MSPPCCSHSVKQGVSFVLASRAVVSLADGGVNGPCCQHVAVNDSGMESIVVRRVHLTLPWREL